MNVGIPNSLIDYLAPVIIAARIAVMKADSSVAVFVSLDDGCIAADCKVATIVSAIVKVGSSAGEFFLQFSSTATALVVV